MNEDGGWGGWMQGFSLGRRVGSCWNDDVVARVESNNDTVSCERWKVFILNLDLDL